MKSGPYVIRGTPTLCLLYLKKVLHNFLLPLHSRSSSKSQKPSDPHVAFVPPFPRDWSSWLHLFCSSPGNYRLYLFSPDTSLAAQMSILEMFLQVAEHLGWLGLVMLCFSWSILSWGFCFLCTACCSGQHLSPADVYQVVMERWNQPSPVLLFWKLLVLVQCSHPTRRIRV